MIAGGGPEVEVESGVPDTAGFATKLDLATELLTEALNAGVPFRWVAMDGGYGQYAQIRAAGRCGP